MDGKRAFLDQWLTFDIRRGKGTISLVKFHNADKLTEVAAGVWGGNTQKLYQIYPNFRVCQAPLCPR